MAFLSQISLMSSCSGQMCDLSRLLSDGAAFHQLLREVSSRFAVSLLQRVDVVVSVKLAGGKDRQHTHAIGSGFCAESKCGFVAFDIREQSVVTSPTALSDTKRSTNNRKCKALKTFSHRTGDGSRDYTLVFNSLLLPPASNVLLVFDWIESEEIVLASAEFVSSLGAVVLGGVSVVCLNESSNVHLARLDFPFYSLWSPKHGRIQHMDSKNGSQYCIHEPAVSVVTPPRANRQEGKRNAKRQAHEIEEVGHSVVKKNCKKNIDMQEVAVVSPIPNNSVPCQDLKKSPLTQLQARSVCSELVEKIYRQTAKSHCSASYEANNPGEDGLSHFVSKDHPSIQYYGVYDGHGGNRASKFVQEYLGSNLLEGIKPTSSKNEIINAICSSFGSCEQSFLKLLESFPAEERMSPGYCNAGTCVVVALLVGKVLYTANVGDCQAILCTYSNSKCIAKALSVMHNCYNEDEVKRVRDLSKDRNAIQNRSGILRVAGSLTVTRAIGDQYLKTSNLSRHPFKPKVPYITAGFTHPNIDINNIMLLFYIVEPDITAHSVSSEDKFVILASDGLWDFLSPGEAVQIVIDYVNDDGWTKVDPAIKTQLLSPSSALVYFALEKAANDANLSLKSLYSLPQGRARRCKHDDITCTVVFLN